MKILAVSDEESKYYYEHYSAGKLDEFDLIIGCGDLRKDYLEFLATMAKCHVMYVRGNHDDLLNDDPPGGCECIDGRLVEYKGIRILGLGGSQRYKEGLNMYTEADMKRRYYRLLPRIRRAGGIDILVTHSPARGVNDLDDDVHRGYETFNEIIRRYEPQYMVHGHIHKSYAMRVPQATPLGTTTVMNACDYCTFEIETD